MRKIKYISLLALLLIIFMVFAPAASAHRVHIQEQITQVQIKAWYGGGDPMAFADIEIYSNKSGEENLYMTGKTDKDGLYNFTPQLGASGYRVVVSATGHKGESEFNMAEGQQEEAELPLYMQLLTGFGLLTGLAGISMYISARKIQKEYKEK